MGEGILTLMCNFGMGANKGHGIRRHVHTTQYVEGVDVWCVESVLMYVGKLRDTGPIRMSIHVCYSISGCRYYGHWKLRPRHGGAV